MTDSATHVRDIEESSAYWRVRFEHPPFNIVDDTIFQGLQELLARMDAKPGPARPGIRERESLVLPGSF
jgi:hypothetical protein